MSPPPVIIARRTRQRGEDWDTVRSWIGGLPRLGVESWPRGEAGAPLVFLAQIDLRELAEACPESPLPCEGALAFFTGTGEDSDYLAYDHRVLHVPGNPTADTPLPPDAVPVRRVDEYSFPVPSGVPTERMTFAKWGIEFATLPLPAHLRDYADASKHAQILAETTALTQARYPDCSRIFNLPKGDMPWLAVRLVYEKLQEAIANGPRTLKWTDKRIADYEALIGLPRHEVSRRGIDAAGLQREIDSARAYKAQKLDMLESLPVIVAELEAQLVGRDHWQTMDAASIRNLDDLCKSLWDRFRTLAPSLKIDRIARTCGIEMAGGSVEAFGALSDEHIERINGHCRLTHFGPHQMFGISRETHDDVTSNCDKVMLLQLAWDDMMDWQFGDCCTLRYWITHEDMEQRRWDRVIHTFEGG